MVNSFLTTFIQNREFVFCILATNDDKERWLPGVWEHSPHKGKLWWLGLGNDLMDKSVMVIHSNLTGSTS